MSDQKPIPIARSWTFRFKDGHVSTLTIPNLITECLKLGLSVGFVDQTVKNHEIEELAQFYCTKMNCARG